jgi:hypothetical protein
MTQAHAQHDQQQHQQQHDVAAAPRENSSRNSAPLYIVAAASIALLSYQIANKAIPFYGDVLTRSEIAERAREWQLTSVAPIALPEYSSTASALSSNAAQTLAAAAARVMQRANGETRFSPTESVRVARFDFTALAADLAAAGLSAEDAAAVTANARAGSAKMCRLPIQDGNVVDGDRVVVSTSGGAIPAGASGLRFEFDLSAMPFPIPVPCGATIEVAAIADGRGGGVVFDIAGHRAKALKTSETLTFKVR